MILARGSITLVRAAAIVLVLGLVGPGLTLPVVAQSSGDPAVEGIDWIAVDAEGVAVRFDDGIAVIADACGEVDIDYALEPDIAGLRIGADGLEPLCPATRHALAVLLDIDGYRIIGGRLRLVDAASRSLLELVPRSPEALPPSGAWQAIGFDALGDGALTEPRAHSGLRVTFAADSALDGSSACGGFIGSYGFDGGRVFIGVRGFGVVPCSERARAEEVAFTDALQAAETWRRAGDRLELVDADGVVRVVLEADSDSVIGSWVVAGVARDDGRMVATDGAAVRLDLIVGGTFDGSSGCRDIHGAYLAEDDRIAFVEVSPDGLRCDGDDRRSERRFLRALDRVIAWRRDGDALTLTDAVGNPLVELIAADAG